VPTDQLIPNYKLVGNRWYNVRVTFADGVWFKFNIIIDALKPVAIPTVQYRDADGAWQPYVANTLTNGDVRFKVNLPELDQSGWNDTWPIGNHRGEYRIVSSTIAGMPATPAGEWMPLSTRDFYAPDFTGLEGTITYGFRMVSSETGQGGTEQRVAVKVDQKAPVVTDIPLTPVADGYTAYGKNPTWKFGDLNKIGAVTYDFYDYEGASLGSVTKEAHNIGNVTFTENGIYKNVKIYDAAGNYAVIDDFVVDKAVPGLTVPAAAQMYPGVAGSPLVVTPTPSFADDGLTHGAKIEYSLDNVTWTEAEMDGNTFVIYPKADDAISGKYYFRAVNERSGLASTVRSLTVNVAQGPLVLFGDIARLVAEGDTYTIGKQVKVEDVHAYADGKAEIVFKKNGNALAPGATLGQGQTYTATVTTALGGTVDFTLKVSTAKPNFSLSAVTVKNAPYQKNTWVKDNVKLTITASAPDMDATYRYSIDGGATWKVVTLANGTYTFNVNCASGAELDRTYQFKAEAASGAEAGIQNFQVKIDKVVIGTVEVSGSIADGKDAYSSNVNLTANKPVAYTYTFTAPDGTVTDDVSAGSPREVRQLSENGTYSNIVASDKVGNTLAIPGTIRIAKKPDLTVTPNGEGTAVTLTVTNAVPANLVYEVSADNGKTWAETGETFTATEEREYRFRATNTLSGAVSSVVRATLVPAAQGGPSAELIAAAQAHAAAEAEAKVAERLYTYAADIADQGAGDLRNAIQSDEEYINVPDSKKKDKAAYDALFEYLKETFKNPDWAWLGDEERQAIWAGFFAFGGVHNTPWPEWQNDDRQMIHDFVSDWASDTIRAQYYQPAYEEAYNAYITAHYNPEA
jgi:hypothetical protein